MPRPFVRGHVFLLCRIDSRLCALPIENVVETMRPLPADELAGGPPFLRGVSVIRGEAIPVVDGAALVGAAESHPTRFVTIAVNERRIALAVDAVVGVKTMSDELGYGLPPLLTGAAGELVTAIGALDAELLIVLEGARLVPESVWALVRESVPA